MRFAYADPPYLGQAARLYGDPTFDEPAAHAALFEYLATFDGWIYHLTSGTLGTLLPLAPPETRVLAWAKPWAVWRRGQYPVFAWEPVLLHGGRGAEFGSRLTPRDYLAEPAINGGLIGAKPEPVCHWLFDCLGAEPDDALDDLFPGSGAVGRAWRRYVTEPRLPWKTMPEQERLAL